MLTQIEHFLAEFCPENIMLEYCLNCDYEETLEPKTEPVIITVRGEAIEAIEEFYQCPACGEKFTSSLGHDALDDAYREYRRRHGLLQPEEIRHWRESYGLTTTELSHLLDWDEATLNRYEQGALQEQSENIQLRFVMVPQNLLYLIITKPEAFDAEKRTQLIAQLSADQTVVQHLEAFYAIYGENVLPEKLAERQKLSIHQWIDKRNQPVFSGTSIPVHSLIESLKGGYSIDDFLQGFPAVRREQVFALLDEIETQFKSIETV